MRIKKLIQLVALFSMNVCFAQSDYYDVNACEGCGLRMWGGNFSFGITMGDSPSFHYGPVNDFSIKTLMEGAGRGWTWGTNGGQPVAALNTQGNMQIAGGFNTASLSVGTQINSRLIALYDSPTNWYGFGIQDSQMRLQVGGTTARFSFFAGDSNEVMTVRGDGNVSVNAENAGFGIDAGTPRLGFIKKFGSYPELASSAGAPIIFSQTDQSGILTNISGATLTERMRIDANGNVGIGSSAPDSKLTVNGKIHATEVNVTTTVPGPDYVFEKDYELLSLSDVKSYIDENKHLPEVPSAKEMEKSGVNLSEMNMLLLKKVEELTLYLIEQNRLISKQSERIVALENKK